MTAMTPAQLNKARQIFGLSRKEFGRRIGLQGKSNNIWNEVKRMETGEREIPESIALTVNMMLESDDA